MQQTLKSKIEQVLSDILSDKHECQIKIKYIKENNHEQEEIPSVGER